MHLLMLFVDGVGLGPRSADNPLAQVRLAALEDLAGGQALTAELRPRGSSTHIVRSIDANLDVAGLPQSGTGQASLFTGINCAAIAGRHYGPFPHSTSKPVVRQHSIFQRLKNGASSDVAFANAYPDRFFSFVRTTDRWTVTTLCCHYADVELRGEAALARGEAIPANITGEGWPGDPIEILSEARAAKDLAALARQHRFTLFEYFLTDKAGHGRGNIDPIEVLYSLDRFVEGLLNHIGNDITLVLVSDHGNLEDISTRSHTRHPVPLLAAGPEASIFQSAVSILDVTPAIAGSRP
jgi:2,3-bisphosphoglycerate-independent phosphoglycerate mutase